MARQEDKPTVSAAPSPQSPEAELAVIGSIFFSPKLAFDYIDRIRPEFFFSERNQSIVEVIIDLVSNNIRPDALTVSEKLKQQGHDLHTSDFQVLKEYVHFAQFDTNIESWLDELKRFWEIRRIVEVCSSIATRGRKVRGSDVQEFLGEVEKTFMEIADARTSAGLVSAADVIQEVLQELKNTMDNPGAAKGVSSGFRKLDETLVGGFHPSDLVILAARPAMGKTALALNFATNAALSDKQHRVAIFSLEMSRHQLMQRVISTAARIKGSKFRDGSFNAEELDRLVQSLQQFMNDRILIDDSFGVNILELISRCRKAKHEKGGQLDLIIVDYLQLVTGGAAVANKNSREQEVAFISRQLKGLAREMKCPVIALSQLSRGPEKSTDKRPKTSDLRESGSIEQDADQVLFIYRDEVYNPNSPDKGIAEIIVAKNRHGAIDTVKLAFRPELTAFGNLETNFS